MQPAVHLDVETAKTLIRSVDEGFAAVDVTSLGGGDNSAAFEVRSDDGRSVVIKTYADELHWKMQKELFAYELLEATRPAVPLAHILGADDSKRLFDRNYLVMTKLEGTLLVSVLDRLDPEDLDTIDGEIGAALAAMHRVELPAFGYLGQDGIGEPFATNADYMRAQFTKKLDHFDRLGGDPDTSRVVRTYVDRRSALLDGCRTPVFCHDDCHEGNVLVGPGPDGWHVRGIVDLENAVAGDPLLDVAKTEAYKRRRSDRRLRALIAAYGPMRAAWRDALDLYTVYHWLELWDWFAAHDRREPLASLVQSMRKVCDAAG
ncbi:MAG: phosphotransferase family protein [Actinomycetota bacterium]